MFAMFDDQAQFDEWHESIKLKLGYPIVGTNQLTGEPDLLNITTKYTIPRFKNGLSSVLAWVGDETFGLNLIDNPQGWKAAGDWVEAEII
jgi:hypothetical protein